MSAGYRVFSTGFLLAQCAVYPQTWWVKGGLLRTQTKCRRSPLFVGTHLKGSEEIQNRGPGNGRAQLKLLIPRPCVPVLCCSAFCHIYCRIICQLRQPQFLHLQHSSPCAKAYTPKAEGGVLQTSLCGQRTALMGYKKRQSRTSKRESKWRQRPSKCLGRIRSSMWCSSPINSDADSVPKSMHALSKLNDHQLRGTFALGRTM